MSCHLLLRGRRLLALAVVGAGFAATALAQSAAKTESFQLPKLQPQKPIGAVRIPVSKIAMKQNPAIQHQPFTLRDAKGKPIDPGLKVSSPDGKQVTAREYVDELNEVEKALNALGHSLRNRDAAPASLAVDQAALTRQTDLARKSFHKLGAPAVKAPRVTPELRAKREAEVKELLATLKGTTPASVTATKTPGKPAVSPEILKPPAGGAAKPAASPAVGVAGKFNKNVVKDSPKPFETYRPEVVEQSKLYQERTKQKAVAVERGNWRADFGDRDLFATDLSAHLEVRSQMDGNGEHHTSSMLATTHGGGYVVNRRVDVFRAAAILNTDHQSRTNLHLQIDLFGRTLTNQNVGPGEGNANTVNLDQGVGPIEIPIGPFYVSGEYLLRAKVGMHYNLQVDAGRTILELQPTVSSTLGHWRGGGVGFKGAKIGATFGGTLTWINQQLYLRGEAAKGVEKPSQRRTLTVSSHGHNNFETLAGTLEIRGKLGVFDFGAEGTLAKLTWPGFRLQGVLFDSRKVEYPR